MKIYTLNVEEADPKPSATPQDDTPQDNTPQSKIENVFETQLRVMD